jgi:signal transduction histidine kinase
MIFRFVLFLLVFILLIRFVMRFILPVMKMTRMTHQHMNDMKKKMDEMKQGSYSGNPSPGQKKQVDGDYIDYEEVK